MAHWRAAIRILRYLLATRNLALTYNISVRAPAVCAFTDAAFGNENGGRSRYGYVVFVAGCLVSWSTKTTTMVCLSTAEAEFVAATEAAKDVMWLRGLLTELGYIHATPCRIFEDNQACVAMIKNHVVSPRNRHFAVKMAWLRERVADMHLVFVYVPSKKNIADILTKILNDEQFLVLRALIFQTFRDAGILPPGEC
jgi:hypothetical protein